MAVFYKIARDLMKGNFSLILHAEERMDERSIFEGDLMNVGRTYFEKYYHEKRNSYNFVGYALDERVITVACQYYGETLIITMFEEEE
ncbi:MAG: DUF4258 domain-containing protein [Oligoflexia bacterium]|nr:DUF4258 domain-containing protein [Oligoflexia bacterium]MBF0366232.1 DUF4258 domain-containing protein [Oligoflexia bacterium]